jgi:hypothetical protein
VANAEQAFKSYSDFMAGGVWTRTTDEGEQLRHTYRWVLGDKFVQFKDLGAERETIILIGHDPNTEKIMRWAFFEGGAVGISTLTQTGDGEWTIGIQAKSPESGSVYTGKRVIRKEGPNRLRAIGDVKVNDEARHSENVWTRVPE